MDSNGNDEFLTFKPVCADPVKAVLDKISNSRYANQFPNPKDELRFATMLADKSHLLQTYLNKDWVEIIPTTHSHKQQIMIQPNSSETSPRASNPHSQNHSHQQNSMSGSNTSNNLDATAASSSSPLHNELMHSTPTPSHGTVGSSVFSGEECSHHSLTQLNHHEMNSSGGRIRNRTTVTSSSTMTTTNNVSFHPVIMNESSNNNNNNQMNNTSVPQRSPHAFDEDHQDHEEEDEDNEHDNHHEDADEEDTESTDGSESEEDEETEEEKQVMNEFIEEQKKQLLKGKVDIKLIIVDQERDQKLKSSARKLLSPILSKFSSSISSFGMFHSSILIGNWILEWNDSALCVPRRTLSKAALFCADLEPITTLEDLDVVINKLADVIVEWNTTKKYKPMGGNRCIYGNCQDFCEAVLARIGVDFRIKNPYVRHFFEQLKKKGSTDLKLYFQKEEAEVPNSFANKFKLLSASGGSNSIKFATHEQLDQFVLRCLRIDPEMKTNYPDVWSLLKGFDRAFWLRHLAWEEMKEKKRRELVSVERNLFKISQLRRAKKLTDEDVLTENRLFERANEIKKEFERIEKEGKPVRPFMGKQLDERKELVEVDLCPFSNPLTTYSIRLYH
ncbi:hypothetical protein C9374_001164 [Naegleria lovaniensis]|uniref:Uncharacterized protein n=1 Tax=Naegleria lovaniensis TaxID=51637 RepID=A0AA88GVB9_NAELO|nr:uncharacterized protein C9374_001164 [Naegleria lovaniensis]KAG2387570.1 hypothetical protein C9374_001164 [Naegleria lovaniensis]